MRSLDASIAPFFYSFRAIILWHVWFIKAVYEFPFCLVFELLLVMAVLMG